MGERTWASPAVELWQADARDLSFLPDASVDCCVTSPPYWGLRAYHAGDGEIGQEQTIEEWVASLVAVFGEVRRLLRPWGTLWLNAGDCYVGGGNNRGSDVESMTPKQYSNLGSRALVERTPVPAGLHPGDLAGLPWRLAFALQADGWTLRSANVWAKPAPMPESVDGWRWERCRIRLAPSKAAEQGHRPGTDINEWVGGPMGGGNHRAEWGDCPGCPKCAPNDGLVLRRGSGRPTRAHEYVFQFTKSTGYFSDREAVAEDASENTHSKGPSFHPMPRTLKDGEGLIRNNESFNAAIWGTVASRNIRSVWTIGPEPLASGSGHYAAFPTRLPEICILASTSERGNCTECGMPWARAVETHSAYEGNRRSDDPERLGTTAGTGWKGGNEASPQTRTVGWRATCQHRAAGTVPPVVLDPFVGSGSSCVAAQRLGRRSIGVDLKGEYLALARRRLEEVPLPLASSVPP